MHANQAVALVIGAAAFLAALIYIGRQISRLVLLMTAIAKLPGVVSRLETATDANTRAIGRLTERLDGQDHARHAWGRA